MSKKKPPLVPRKEEYQGKTEQQVNNSSTFATFAIICLLTTLLASIIHEIILLWASK